MPFPVPRPRDVVVYQILTYFVDRLHYALVPSRCEPRKMTTLRVGGASSLATSRPSYIAASDTLVVVRPVKGPFYIRLTNQ